MNTHLKKVMFGFLILLLSACAPVQPVSTPEPVVTDNPVEITADDADATVPGNLSKYIGLNYSLFPEGLINDVSMLIQDAEDHGLFVVSDGENKMLWLSKMTHRDADGNAYWEVKDILELSDMESGTNLLLDGCSVNGTPDHEIFVLGRGESIVRAWRANTTLNVFEEIPVTGLECHSDKVVPF